MLSLIFRIFEFSRQKCLIKIFYLQNSENSGKKLEDFEKKPSIMFNFLAYHWSDVLLALVELNSKYPLLNKKVCKATAVRCLFVFVCWYRGEAI